MANFKGHALPGSFFLLFGLWWPAKFALKHYSMKRNKKGRAHRSFDHLEIIEGAVKVIFAVIGILGEQFVPDGPHLYLYTRDPWSWVKMMNWQHCTMYLFFVLSGVVDVLTYCPARLPLGLDRLMLAIALFVEGVLLYFHVQNRPMLDQHIHALLLIAIFATSASILLEIFLRDNVILELLRTTLCFVQGTWFWQIGFVLYPPFGGPTWDEADHENMMFITMCFCWHIAVAIAMVTVIYTLVQCFVQRCRTSNRRIQIRLSLQKQKNTKDSCAFLLNASDEE
ncbi:transmembrane protein 45B-like [Anolis sagrei]|uniref:transmembrane protein 45B-like n=1 Tax=Anolis sagrei TaxID=38937 RepID=UPI003520822A